MNTTSTLGKLNFLDVSKSLLLAAILPVITIIFKSFQAGNFAIDYQLIVQTAITGLIAGIGHALVTNSNGVPFTPEPVTIQSVTNQVFEAMASNPVVAPTPIPSPVAEPIQAPAPIAEVAPAVTNPIY